MWQQKRIVMPVWIQCLSPSAGTMPALSWWQSPGHAQSIVSQCMTLKAQKAYLPNERRVQKFSHWNEPLSSSTSIYPVDEKKFAHSILQHRIVSIVSNFPLFLNCEGILIWNSFIMNVNTRIETNCFISFIVTRVDLHVYFYFHAFA